MLNKKTCKNCGKKISQKDNFCPNCGAVQKSSAEKQKEQGLLGNDDNINNHKQTQDPMGMGSGMLNKMVNGMVKMLEKEMQKNIQKEMQNSQNNPEKNPFQEQGKMPQNFKLMINGKEVDLGNRNSKNENSPKTEKQPRELTQKDLPYNKLRGFAKKDKQEPSTSVKRFSDRVIYEINIPGVESREELSITKLENSIEVRAKSKNKSYFKVIPIDSPITGYDFKKGKLSLEFSE